MSDPKSIPHINVFEQRGEAQVLAEFSDRKDEVGRAARTWLRVKEFERNLSNSTSAEAIAKEHLRIARQQRNIAIIAMLLSAITAILAAIISATLSQWK